MEEMKEQNFGKVSWKPKKSRYTREEMIAAYAAEAVSRRDQVAAKTLMKDLVVDLGDKVEVSNVLPPSMFPVIARTLSFYTSTEQVAIRAILIMGAVSASVNLAQDNLVVGGPQVQEKVPIMEKERRKDLDYAIDKLPKLRQPEDYTNSAEIFYWYSHESVEETTEMMELTCLNKGLPFSALTTEMLPSPFAPDFFTANPQNVTAPHGMLIRQYTERFLQKVPPGSHVWCLWGDAGKFVIP